MKRKNRSGLLMVGMVLVLVLSLSAFTCTPNSYARAGKLAKDFSASVLLVQQGVMTAHKTGYIDDQTNQLIETEITQVADAGIRLDKAINDAHSVSGATAELTLIRQLLQDLSQNKLAGIKNEQSKVVIQSALLTAQTIIDSIAAFGGGGQ